MVAKAVEVVAKYINAVQEDHHQRRRAVVATLLTLGHDTPKAAKPLDPLAHTSWSRLARLPLWRRQRSDLAVHRTPDDAFGVGRPVGVVKLVGNGLQSKLFAELGQQLLDDIVVEEAVTRRPRGVNEGHVRPAHLLARLELEGLLEGRALLPAVLHVLCVALRLARLSSRVRE